MAGTLWVLLVAMGFGWMWAMRWTRNPMLDAIFVRAAAFSFAGAGIVGANGWLGGALKWTVTQVNAISGAAGTAGLGTAAVWIVWAALSIMWVLTLVPERWFGKSIPDWLSVGGIVLPGLAMSIPGPLGAALTRVMTLAGGLMVGVVKYLVGAK
jgi:hypothetical protein